MKKVLKNLSKSDRKKIKKKKIPAFTKPMLVKLTRDRFFKKDWIYERKLDGERCLIFIYPNKTVLKTRNDKNVNDSYPELEKAARNLKSNQMILDGEIVAFEDNVTSFSKLQSRMHVKDRKQAERSDVKVFCYIFDIIYLDGYDISELDIITRKNILKKVILFKDPLRYTPHRINNTKKYYNKACKSGWEGLIVKKRDSKYQHGRSSEWLKFKCTNEQEFAIGGYTEPRGERKGFGALLVGYYEDERFKYAGKVGTGFSDDDLERLKKRFKKLKSSKNPFEQDVSGKKINWVEPKLVCQVGFTEWTDEGKLRHPRYLGLRRDKPAKKVHKEK